MKHLKRGLWFALAVTAGATPFVVIVLMTAYAAGGGNLYIAPLCFLASLALSGAVVSWLATVALEEVAC